MPVKTCFAGNRRQEERVKAVFLDNLQVGTRTESATNTNHIIWDPVTNQISSIAVFFAAFTHKSLLHFFHICSFWSILI